MIASKVAIRRVRLMIHIPEWRVDLVSPWIIPAPAIKVVIRIVIISGPVVMVFTPKTSNKTLERSTYTPKSRYEKVRVIAATRSRILRVKTLKSIIIIHLKLTFVPFLPIPLR